MDTSNLNIEHNIDQQQFEINLPQGTALVTYRRRGDEIHFMHTEVPDAFEGQGIGSKLARHVLDYAREHQLGVRPYCPFIAAYIKRHEAYQELVVEG